MMEHEIRAKITRIQTSDVSFEKKQAAIRELELKLVKNTDVIIKGIEESSADIDGIGED